MPSTQPQINIRLSDAQIEAAQEAARRAGGSLAQFIRWGLALACADQGVEFPDDLPAHGGRRTNDSAPSIERGESRPPACVPRP